jgi:exodeoxyribonuclease-3
MLFITWNVNSLRARLPRVLELLQAHKPDVLAVQETKCSPENFPLQELEGAGYSVLQSSGGRWQGVALLARAPQALAEPLVGLPGDPVPSEARWCEATVGGIRFVSVYVPNGRTLDSTEYPRKLAFLEAMAARARAAVQDPSAPPLLIGGDMNVAPRDDDVYDPAAFVGATHVSAPEREHYAKVLADGELLDGYHALHPDDQQFTWWDYRGGSLHRNLGMRIDHALLSSRLAGRLVRCEIDREFRKGVKPSDHAPLMVELS